MNICKCGVQWSSILYGETCAKCGDHRPLTPIAKAMNVTHPEPQLTAPQIVERGVLLGRRGRSPYPDLCGLMNVSNSTASTTLDKNKISQSIKDLEAMLTKQQEIEREHESILLEVANILRTKGVTQVTNVEVDYLYRHVQEMRNPKPFTVVHSPYPVSGIKQRFPYIHFEVEVLP